MTTFVRAAILTTAVLALVSCASPSNQVSSALTRYGLDQRRAECIGADLASHLSLGQLQELGRAAKAYGMNDRDPAHLTPSDLVRVAAQLDDAAVPVAVARAGLRCGVVAGL